MVLNNGTKFCLNPFTLSKVTESSNRRSRNTLGTMVCLIENSRKSCMSGPPGFAQVRNNCFHVDNMKQLFQDIHIDSIMTFLRQINLFNRI